MSNCAPKPTTRGTVGVEIISSGFRIWLIPATNIVPMTHRTAKATDERAKIAGGSWEMRREFRTMPAHGRAHRIQPAA